MAGIRWWAVCRFAARNRGGSGKVESGSESESTHETGGEREGASEIIYTHVFVRARGGAREKRESERERTYNNSAKDRQSEGILLVLRGFCREGCSLGHRTLVICGFCREMCLPRGAHLATVLL